MADNFFKVRKGLIVNGSGSTIFDIQGSQGQLFSVTDSLIGSLFSVNDISGIPILEVSSDDTVKLGTYQDEAIIVTGSKAIIQDIEASGSFSGSFTGSLTGSLTGSFTGTLPEIAATTDTDKIAVLDNGVIKYRTGTELRSDIEINKTFIDSLNVDADTLDGLNSTQFLRSDSNDTLTSTLKVGSSGRLIFENSSEHGYIPFPGGAWYDGGAGETGAIKITLPTHGTADMVSFYVDIFNYNNNQSISIYITGYLLSSTGSDTWGRVTAITNSRLTTRDFTVRFGGDGTNNCIWIGELTTSWNYPQVVVRDFQAGFTSDIDAYANSWDIDIVTSFDTINETRTGNFPQASNSDTLDGEQGTYYLDYNNFTNTPSIPTVNNNTITISAGNALTGGSSFTLNQASNAIITLNHEDTSGQSSVDNSNGSVIQDVTLDTYGHVTGLGSTDLDNRYVQGTGVVNAIPRFKTNSSLENSIITNTGDVVEISGSSGATFISDPGNKIYRLGDYSNSEASVDIDVLNGKITLNKAPVAIPSGDLDMVNNSINNVDVLSLQDSIQHDGDTDTYLQFHNPDQFRVVTGGAERLEVNNSYTLTNDIRVNRLFDRNNIAYFFHGDSTGDSIRVAGDVVAFYSSDRRYKENIKPIENPIEKLDKIGGYTFNWNKDSHKETGKRDVGVIAQEIEEVLPELVQTRENDYKAVDYPKLTAFLIECIKDQQKQIDELKNLIK